MPTRECAKRQHHATLPLSSPLSSGSGRFPDTASNLRAVFKGFIWLLSTGLAFSGGLQSVLADGRSIDSFSLKELLEIPVEVASNVATQRHLQPATVSVVSGKQLQESGGRTLSEALSMLVPGYFMVGDQDDAIAGFRGLASDNNAKILLLLNGRNLNIEWFWGAPDVLLNSLDMGAIKHVEVIRGPGSVKYGQGALLGVINIVTRQSPTGNSDLQTSIELAAGLDAYTGIAAEQIARQDTFTSYVYASRRSYDGQELRPEGVGLREFRGNPDVIIADRNHLFRSENQLVIANAQSEATGFGIDLLFADQTRDLFEFDTDRNVYGERLLNLSLSHLMDITSRTTLKTRLGYARDDFTLASVDGITTGGTREDRYDVSLTFNIDDWLTPGNRLAFGYDARYFESGKRNYKGANYLVTSLTPENLAQLPDANQQFTCVYPDTTLSHGLFIEDFYELNDQVTLFAAARLTEHPHWGSNISPRLGGLYRQSDNLNWRLSYSTGFRGPVGLHYSGGHRRDGFLEEKNFDRIEAAMVELDDGTLAQNLDEVEPEEMQSLELEVDYQFNPQWRGNLVVFYNRIRHVIDLSAFFNPDCNLPDIGTDVPGDWCGYWFYKNNPGSIDMNGLEATLNWYHNDYFMTLSHSLVNLVSAEDFEGSLYVTGNKHIQTFPPNVSRLQVGFPILENVLSATATWRYDYHWYARSGDRNDGNHVLNLALNWQISPNWQLRLVGKNLLDSDNPQPMTTYPNQPKDDEGTPSLESPTAWLTIKGTLF